MFCSALSSGLSAVADLTANSHPFSLFLNSPKSFRIRTEHPAKDAHPERASRAEGSQFVAQLAFNAPFVFNDLRTPRSMCEGCTHATPQAISLTSQQLHTLTPLFCRPRQLIFCRFSSLRTLCKNTRVWHPECLYGTPGAVGVAFTFLTKNSRSERFVTIDRPVASEKQARRYFVSGLVQGVGYRYFTQDAAERLQLAGYVRNLRDGRVEAYAIGAEDQLVRFLASLKKGPRGAMVQGVVEEPAAPDKQYAREFSITQDDW